MKDHGDIYPSDADDTSPGDRLNEFVEVDYDIEQLKPKKIKAPLERDMVPDPGIEPPLDNKREVLFGIILNYSHTGPDDFEYYKVGVHDGRIIIAYTALDTLDTRYNAGTPVTLVKDSSKEGWTILCPQTPDELGSLTLYPTGSPVGKNFIVDFDAVKNVTPIDDTMGNVDIFVQDSGGFKLNSHQCLVHIDFNVTVEAVDPVPIESKLYFQHGCWRPGDQVSIEPNEVAAHKLWFNGQNGFQITWDYNDCTLGLSIGSDTVQDAILNQQYTSEPAFWTNSPKLGGNLWIGRKMSRGWFQIGPEDEAMYIKQTTGYGKLKFQWPGSGPPSAPSFMIAQAASGECVQAGWLQAGGDGDVCLQSCELYGWNYCYINTYYGTTFCAVPVYKEKTYTFRNGLLISGPDITYTPNTQTPVCEQELPDDSDPCGYL